jgi:hypothetical protein
MAAPSGAAVNVRYDSTPFLESVKILERTTLQNLSK